MSPPRSLLFPPKGIQCRGRSRRKSRWRLDPNGHTWSYHLGGEKTRGGKTEYVVQSDFVFYPKWKKKKKFCAHVCRAYSSLLFLRYKCVKVKGGWHLPPPPPPPPLLPRWCIGHPLQHIWGSDHTTRCNCSLQRYIPSKKRGWHNGPQGQALLFILPPTFPFPHTHTHVVLLFF